jgi:hypothetical protein
MMLPVRLELFDTEPGSAESNRSTMRVDQSIYGECMKARYLLAAVAALLGCGGSGNVNGDPRLSAPPGTQYGQIRFIGTSATDIWTATGLDGTTSHFDGHSWTPVFQAPDPSYSHVAVAGPNSVWIAGYRGIYRLAADGTKTDFTADIDFSHGEQAKLLAAHGGAIVQLVSGSGSTFYVFDGEHFVRLPALDSKFFPTGAVAVWAKDNLYVSARLVGSAPGGPDTYLHWDGTSWSVVADDVPAVVPTFSDAYQAFPPSTLWLRGTGSTPTELVLDATGLHKNTAAIPAGTHDFGYVHGHPTLTFESGGAGADNEVSQACDVNGNCVNLDIPTQVKREAYRMEWDGTRWTNLHTVAVELLCAGAACAYRQVPFGVMGNLEDGTQIYGGVPDGETQGAYFIDRP